MTKDFIQSIEIEVTQQIHKHAKLLGEGFNIIVTKKEVKKKK